MAERETGKEKVVTFNKGTPEERTVTLHETPHHDYVGAHKHAHGAYGAAAVTEKLRGLDFPASRQEIMDRLGKEDLHWSKDQTVNLRVLFDRIPERVESPIEVVKAISDNLEEVEGQER